MTDSAGIEFGPDRARYTIRCFWDVLCVTLLINAGLSLVALLLLAKEGIVGGFAVMAGLNIIFWPIAALYILAWVPSVRYEMTDEEVIVHKGVLSRVQKIVPYRTVTNVTIQRGLLDRIWLGLGAVHVQTAGAGATNVAEEKLVGLSDFEGIRDAIVEHLRRYRADTSPAMSGVAGPSRPSAKPSTSDASDAILAKLEEIRQLLARRA